MECRTLQVSSARNSEGQLLSILDALENWGGRANAMAMEASQSCPRAGFRQVGSSHGGEISGACSKDFEAVRPATEEEEAWLDSEERFLHHEEEWAVLQANALLVVRDTEAQPFLSEDAEVFIRDNEIAHWMQAQEEVSAIQEAEFFCSLEEEIERELLELANAEDIHRHLMMKALVQGAKFLIDAESAEKADYQALVSIQQSAQKLLELVDQAIHVKMEEERREALNQITIAMLQQREIADAAAQERAHLKAEIVRLKRDYRDLNELLEREKDRTTCRICFIRPRDVLPLPCMHFDYCNVCLHQYQKTRNLCPTCRSPISGVLKYNLTIG